MNAAQARALVALFDRIAELRRQPVDELHAAGITIECCDDSSIDRLVDEEGWQGVTIWQGGLGLELLLDLSGVVHSDPGAIDDDVAPETVDLYLDDEGKVDWVAEGRGLRAFDPARAIAGAELAVAVDRFYRDLRYTAPEMVGQRLNELGARITEPMKTFGYPRAEEAPDA